MPAGDDDRVPAVPDAGKKTLHLRCGDDIRGGLAEAGFQGEFGTFAYPFVHGPSPAGNDRAAFIKIGTRFLVETGFAQSKVETQRRLIEEFMLLDASIGTDRVCLWFEHDAYDVLCLLFLLDWYAKNGSPKELTYVCCDGHPSVDDFRGLGQLSPAALRDVWGLFSPVTQDILALGSECWSAYTASDPTELWNIIERGTPQIPQIAPALRRQVRELPDQVTGLSLTEYLTLRVLEEHGDLTASDVFRHYTLEHEPLVFMGDLGFRQCVMLPLASGPAAAIDLRTGDDEDWWRSTTVCLTETGKALLAGNADWIDLTPADRWVGGVHVTGDEAGWRYCRESETVRNAK